MFDATRIVVGLEIGTSKVCAIVGELDEEGQLSIIGLGQSRSSGVRKGEIVDMERAEADIRQAVGEAEQMANVEVQTVYLAVSGGHIRGFDNCGVHTVRDPDGGITEEDVAEVLRNARTLSLPAHEEVIHTVRQHFQVDGRDDVREPVGMLGRRLEARVHVITGELHRLQNSIRAVRSVHLEVEEIVFSGLASALAVLNPEEKRDGVLVIDMGGGTTDYVVFAGGILRHAGVLAVGGDHVTNDLASGLKLSLYRAEQLKVDYGAAFVEDRIRGQTLDLTSDVGLPLRSVNLEHLRRIMHLRLEETFELVRREIEEAGLYDCLRAGVQLCGGCARIPHVAALAEQVFELPVSLGRTVGVNGLKSALDQPEFATGIGLLKFAQQQQRIRPARRGLMRGLAERLRSLIHRP
ncbi:MAG: cell division protein FtsA [Verrucomicrobiota bacterium]|nr:cell division protein FtsA [Limisphaera sp.]MDW8381690.1 cell division protein FtsA [Verrucomicrobiota bacterium]